MSGGIILNVAGTRPVDVAGAERAVIVAVHLAAVDGWVSAAVAAREGARLCAAVN